MRAAESLPLLLSHLNSEQLSPEALQYVEILKEWDYEYRLDAIAPMLFSEWFRSFYINTWVEFYQFEDSLSLLYPRYWRTIALLKDQPEHELFDQKSTPEREQAADIVQLSFEEMNQKVAEALKEEDSLEWYRQRNSRIYHMGRIPAFHSKPLAVGGDAQALNAINSWGAGPSWRMIVAFGPDQKAYGVYPGGQSGNPGSPNNDNMIDQWAKGELYELLFLKDEQEEHQRILGRQVFGQ